MATNNFNSAGQLNQLEHDPENHAKRVDNYVWDGSAWVRQDENIDGAVLDGSDPTTKATVKSVNTQVTSADNGLVTNAVLHGKTTGGGGGFVDVKVNPSGALTTDATISGNVSTEAAIYDKRLDDTSTANAIYIGEAAVGVATSAASWRVKRLDISSGLVVEYAGTGTFNQIWDNRTSLTYN